MEMIDDCEGALTISSLRGPKLAYEDWLAQMEIDFLAGLDDKDAEACLASIQRLGGLKLPFVVRIRTVATLSMFSIGCWVGIVNDREKY